MAMLKVWKQAHEILIWYVQYWIQNWICSMKSINMFIGFQQLLKVTNTCIHVWILNKLPPTDNANEYYMNYAMVYYTKCK